MSKGALAWMILALTAARAAAEILVTTSGPITAGYVPLLGPISNSMVTNSPITASGSSFEIGITDFDV